MISVEWMSDREIVSSSDDGTVRRWSAETGTLLETVDLNGIETDTFVCDGGGRIFVGNDEGAIVCLAGRERTVVQAHDAGIKRIVRGGDGSFVTTSYDRTAKVWTCRDDGQLDLRRTIDVPDIVWLRSVAFAGPTRLVFATFGRTYASYDLDLGCWELDDVGTTPGINSVRMIGDDVYTVGDAGVVYRCGRPVAEMGSLCNFLDRLGPTVVTGGQTGQLFDAATGEVLLTRL